MSAILGSANVLHFPILDDVDADRPWRVRRLKRVPVRIVRKYPHFGTQPERIDKFSSEGHSFRNKTGLLDAHNFVPRHVPTAADRPFIGRVSLLDVNERKINIAVVGFDKVAVDRRNEIPRRGSANASRNDDEGTVRSLLRQKKRWFHCRRGPTAFFDIDGN